MHDLDAGVTDQNVNATECLSNGSDPRLDRALIGHIHRHGQPAPTGTLELGKHRICRGSIQIRDGHRGTFAREGQRQASADAAGGSRNNRGFARESHWTSAVASGTRVILCKPDRLGYRNLSMSGEINPLGRIENKRLT
jgi:hypothetical protein